MSKPLIRKIRVNGNILPGVVTVVQSLWSTDIPDRKSPALELSSLKNSFSFK